MATVRVQIEPLVLQWAINRSGREQDLFNKFPKLDAWLNGEARPTWRQLREFARHAYVAEGYLYLSEPPQESSPIADLRTSDDRQLSHFSPDLVDTIYKCQYRQDWFHDFAVENDYDPLEFVGSSDLGDSPTNVARSMRDALGLSAVWRSRLSNWQEFRRKLIDEIEAIGVLVMVNGVVGNNTYRKLDPAEFRGFALSDPYSPLIFVNGADTPASQLFTLGHELAHVWVDQGGLSEPDTVHFPHHALEVWCNAVAAEMLVPNDELSGIMPRRSSNLSSDVEKIRRHFKVSNLVVLRSLMESDFLPQSEFSEVYDNERAIAVSAQSQNPGGDFYPTELMRVGRRFARALIPCAQSGATSFGDALRLLEIKNPSTLDKLGERLGLG